MQLADSELVAAALRGEQSGIAGIYDRYADRLNNYAWSVCRSHADAGDIVQDTFVTASQRLGQLRDPERLRPWLYAIARNHALRVIKQRQRVGVDSEIDMITDFPQPDNGLDAQQLVWSAAAGLDEKDRDILSLHLREGLDGEDLAAALGVKPNAANVALFRVRERLEHAVGALLLHRFARGACADLDTMMAGALTPLIRKRATRHIESCDACQDGRRRIGSPAALFAAMPAALAPAALRDTVLTSWGSANLPLDAEIQSWRTDGFPEGSSIAPTAPPPASSAASSAGSPIASSAALRSPDQGVRRARFAAAAGMVAVVAGFGLYAAFRSTPDTPTQIATTDSTSAAELAVAVPTTLDETPATVLARPESEPETTIPVAVAEPTPTTQPNPTSTTPTVPPTTQATPPTTAPAPTTTVAEPAPPPVILPVNVAVLEFECTDMIRVRLLVTGGSVDPTVTVRSVRNASVTDYALTESLSEPSIYEAELEVLENPHQITAIAESGADSTTELLSDSCGQIG